METTWTPEDPITIDGKLVQFCDDCGEVWLSEGVTQCPECVTCVCHLVDMGAEGFDKCPRHEEKE